MAIILHNKKNDKVATKSLKIKSSGAKNIVRRVLKKAGFLTCFSF